MEPDFQIAESLRNSIAVEEFEVSHLEGGPALIQVRFRNLTSEPLKIEVLTSFTGEGGGMSTPEGEGWESLSLPADGTLGYAAASECMPVFCVIHVRDRD
jgi:hypothetical protein